MSGQADALASLGVLVVDDEADVRELLVEYFRTKQFDVSAGGGRAGGAGGAPQGAGPLRPGADRSAAAGGRRPRACCAR